MNSKTVNYSIHFLIAIMSYGRFASKFTCMLQFPLIHRYMGVQYRYYRCDDKRLKNGNIGSSCPLSNTFYWRLN